MGGRGLQRIAVVGTPGSGKTTLARDLAAARGLVHIELDAIFHQTGWQPLDRETFRCRLAERMEAAVGGWTTCGNYQSHAADLVLSRADTVVWLDLPRALVMGRVIRRTLARVMTREELWNGNREPWTNLYAWDPERNIIRWAWVKFPEYRRSYTALCADPPIGIDMVCLRSPAAVRAFLAQATTTGRQ